MIPHIDRRLLAGVALVALAALTALHTLAAGPLYLRLAFGVSALAATAAATQVRHNDVLAWSASSSVATLSALLVVAAHSPGLPDHEPPAWGWNALAVLCSSIVVVLAAAAGARRRPTVPYESGWFEDS